MNRLLSMFALPLIVACLVLATISAGYLRATHAIDGANQQTLVICGADGVEEITLDQDGNPVERSADTCGHCTDCMLTTLILLQSAQTPHLAQTWTTRTVDDIRHDFISTKVSMQRARGPPFVIGV